MALSIIWGYVACTIDLTEFKGLPTVMKQSYTFTIKATLSRVCLESDQHEHLMRLFTRQSLFLN